MMEIEKWEGGEVGRWGVVFKFYIYKSYILKKKPKRIFF
jgi:hypothetical protein